MYLNKIGITFLFLVTLIISMGCVSAENVNVSDTQVSDINVNSVEQSSSSINDGVYDSSPANPAGYDSNSTVSNAVGGNGVYEDVSNSVDSSYSSADGNSVVTDADVSSNKILDYVSTSLNSNYFVNTGMTLSYIQECIENSSSVGGGSVIFSSGNYYNMALKAQDNVNLIGQNAVLYGDGRNYIINLANTNNVGITGFTIMINSNTSNGISGFNVNNCRISNNTILNGGDAINIFKYYTNLTINNNTIRNMTGKWGDAISLVCHNQSIIMDNWVGATISNNIIDNIIFGIFVGGNFKGIISGNVISNSNEGMHFQGKGAKTNGILNVSLIDNTLENIVTGIEMEHPHVDKFSISSNEITANSMYGYAIKTNSYFNKSANGYIEVIDSDFYGLIDAVFYNATDFESGNNGFGS